MQTKIKISIHFYRELNDFLARKKRDNSVNIELSEHSSIKDVIENLGVPHPEVRLILVNGKTANFEYNIQDGDEIQVYPLI